MTDRKNLREAAIAGWNACRKSIYAVCEDIQEKADGALDKPSGLARGPLESQHEHGFYRGEKSASTKPPAPALRRRRMGRLTAVMIVLLAMFVVGSCSWVSTEETRIRYEFKTKCFDAGGTWNMWTNSCDRSAP